MIDHTPEPLARDYDRDETWFALHPHRRFRARPLFESERAFAILHGHSLPARGFMAVCRVGRDTYLHIDVPGDPDLAADLDDRAIARLVKKLLAMEARMT